MSMKLIAPALLSAVLLTGCLGTTNPAGTNAGATAGTNAGTNTGTNVGATVGAGASTGTAASGYYAVGRKWVYDITNVTMGQTQKMTQTWECTAINGDTATIKFSMTGGPAGDSTTTSQVKLNQTPTASGALPEGTAITEQGAESITVGAGTFANAKKFLSTTSDANAETANEQWVDPAVGLVKMVSKIKPKAAAIAGMDLTTTMTMELKSYTN